MDTGTFRLGKYVAFGEFDNWEVYSLDHAPTDLDWCAIAEALKYQNPLLTFDEKSCEKINFFKKFKNETEAAEFENQILSAALDAVDDASKKFILAGINGEVIPGYYSWLVSQMTHDNCEYIRCACGRCVDISHKPQNPIYGTVADKPAIWHGCTNKKHRGVALALYKENKK